MKHGLSHLTLAVATALLACGAGAPARADDTEIFFGASTGAPGNILFVLDTSGSMSWSPKSEDPQPTSNRRLEIMKDALTEVLQQTSNVNIGLMRFTFGDGGAVMYPMRNVDASGAENGRVTLNAVIREGGDDVVETSAGLNSTSELLAMNSGSTLGLRYQNLNIPRGAKITKAHLEFHNVTEQYGSATFSIAGEKAGNSVAFSAGLPSTRSATANPIPWKVSENWTATGGYRSPDLSTTIQEIVDQSSWCGGNALSLLIQTTSGKRSPVAYENAQLGGDGNYVGLAPVLTVEYDEAATAQATSDSCRSGLVGAKVAGSADNIEESSTGVINASDGDLDLYQDAGSTNRNAAIGLRFSKLNVPQGATLKKAEILLNARAVSTATSGTAYAVDVDNAPVFGAAANQLSDSGLTPRTTGVAFSIPASTAGKEVRIDVTGALQAIVSRSAWAAGNNSAFVLVSNAGNFAASAAGAADSIGPRLLVTYQISGKPYKPGDFTVREALQNTLNAMTAEGPTPSTEALYEAYQYLSGGEVDYGKSRAGKYSTRISVPTSYSGGNVNRSKSCPDGNSSHPSCSSESITDAPKYISPLVDDGKGSASCQANELVFLSDGEPNQNSGVAARINRITKKRCSDSDPGKDCAYELAEFLNTEADLSSTIAGKQTARVHSIALSLKEGSTAATYMENLARFGGGGAYEASSKAELVKAFSSITASSEVNSGRFAASAASVDLNSGLNHSDEIYVPLFKPSANVAWLGNLKRYRLDKNGLFYGENGVEAVDPATGEFNTGTRSFWSTSTDGNVIENGGAAELMPKNRTIYSNIVAASPLTDTNNTVNTGNTQLTDALLGASNSTDRSTIINWALGQDGAGNARKTMSDPLHSSPTLLAYRKGGALDRRVFVGSNAGFLHVIDSSNGQEKWSFIPKELLPNLSLYQKGDVAGTHPYGLDGGLNVQLLKDDNNNGIVDSGDKAMLYVGMRRGGRNYYALDVSNPDSPRLAFTILGGTGSDADATRDYRNLGQSWSKPKLATIRLAGELKQVIVLGGGYDTAQDAYGGHVTDTMGNTVFILDAETGAVIWDAKKHSGLATLTNSIPGDISVLDLKGSGHAEHLYAADTGGQVFRFDLNPKASAASDLMLPSSGRLAHIQDSNAEVDNRRFYYAPSVAFIKRLRSRSFVAVSVGSGYREHPLDQKIEEHMYSFRDYGVLTNKGPTIQEITLDKLININDYAGDANSTDATGSISAGANGVSDAIEALEYINSEKLGWYLPFNGQDSKIRKTGEKVLARATVFRNNLFFTTYYPEVSSNACQPSVGKGRMYMLDIVGGDPLPFKPDPDGTKTVASLQSDRMIGLIAGGIPSEASIIKLGGTYRACSGLQCKELPRAKRLNSYMWQQLE